MLKIVHILPSRAKSYGGPVHVAESLAVVATKAGHDAVVLPSTERRPLKVAGSQVYWPGRDELREVRLQARRADLVHVHGLWNLAGTTACQASWQNDVPYLVTPHGMLTRWALARSRAKKHVYWRLFEGRNLSRAAAIHFLNQGELEEARHLLDAPTFVVPNGVDERLYAGLPTRDVLERYIPQAVGKVVVLFLGRLHPKKGLDLLLPAFAQAQRENQELLLLVAGPDESSYRLHVERWVQSNTASGSVILTGPANGEFKRALLGGADVFALTSHEEADAVAVKEAMAASLPVLITRACRLPEAEAHQTGIVTNDSVDEIRSALLRLARDDRFRRSLGRNGRHLVERDFTVGKTGLQMLDVYRAIVSSWCGQSSSRGGGSFASVAGDG